MKKHNPLDFTKKKYYGCRFILERIPLESPCLNDLQKNTEASNVGGILATSLAEREEQEVGVRNTSFVTGL